MPSIILWSQHAVKTNFAQGPGRPQGTTLIVEGPNPMKAAAYVRISTDEERQNPDLQRGPLLREIESQGWELYEVYEDHTTGASDRRPALDRLMEDARRKRFKAVVVWKFDRFGRSVRHLLDALECFRALGIEFRSLTEGIDTSSYVGKLFFTIVAAFAEFERDLLRERVRAGMRAARDVGKPIGRKPAEVDVARARVLFAAGQSQVAVARALGVPRTTLRRALARPDGGPLGGTEPEKGGL